MPRIEKGPNIDRQPRIELTNTLTLDELLRYADKGIGKNREGNTLKILFKRQGAKRSNEGSIVFTPQDGDKHSRFCINLGRSGYFLEDTAVVFDLESRSIIFVHPGPANEASGISIDHKRRAAEFSIPLKNAPQAILNAREKAIEYANLTRKKKTNQI